MSTLECCELACAPGATDVPGRVRAILAAQTEHLFNEVLPETRLADLGISPGSTDEVEVAVALVGDFWLDWPDLIGVLAPFNQVGDLIEYVRKHIPPPYPRLF